MSPPRDENRNFGQVLTFGGSCTDPLLPMRMKFGVLKQTHGLRLHAEFRLDWYIVLPSSGDKPQILPFLDFGVLWCRQLAAKRES